MSESKITQDQNLILLIYLRDDPSNTLMSRIEHMQKSDGSINLEGRDGVFPLSANAILFAQTKAHDVLVKVCAHLLDADFPYLLVPIRSTDGWVAGGRIRSKLKPILERLSVSVMPSSDLD
jgi:hypothetical protein